VGELGGSYDKVTLSVCTVPLKGIICHFSYDFPFHLLFCSYFIHFYFFVSFFFLLFLSLQMVSCIKEHFKVTFRLTDSYEDFRSLRTTVDIKSPAVLLLH